MTTVEIYSPEVCLLGEGPVWSVREQALYWLDIGGKTLYRQSASDTHPHAWSLSDHPGCLAELEPNAVAVAMGCGVQRLNTQSGAVELLCAVPQTLAGIRFNDGKVDPRGRFWASTMQNNFGPNGEAIAIERKEGTLYRFDPDGAVHTMEENLGIPNTLAWSPDHKRFYFADSLQGQIYVYDYDVDSGDIHNKRLFFDAPGYGIPDGSAIDVDGCVWNARWDGGAILRITPEGQVDRVMTLPVPRPTSCAFGGRGLETLYITSATLGLTPTQLSEAPLSGSVFAIHGLTQGLPVPAMATRTQSTNGSTEYWTDRVLRDEY
jgi:sugar lactone lactonase YvrE